MKTLTFTLAVTATVADEVEDDFVMAQLRSGLENAAQGSLPRTFADGADFNVESLALVPDAMCDAPTAAGAGVTYKHEPPADAGKEQG